MRYSRLRLQLAGWFALAVLLGLSLLDISLYLMLERRSAARFARQLTSSAAELARAVEREAAEQPPLPLAVAAHEALTEWGGGPRDGYLVYGPDGTRLAARGPEALLAVADSAPLPAAGGIVDRPLSAEAHARLTVAPVPTLPGVRVVAVASTAGLREEAETLAAWLLLGLPLVLLVSCVAGYALAARALAPVALMAGKLERIDPEALDRRLAVGTPPDELDRLAQQINGLLERLNNSRQQARRFLQQAAHQLRTPLTVLRGESDLALEHPRATDEYVAALQRVSLAASQMSRRVDDLFLLARAEAGERLPTPARVELDGVALEAADLMRGRATRLGRTLTLGEMAPVEVLGDEALLREAVLELLENACRHGEATSPVALSVRTEAGRALVEVQNGGPPLPAVPDSINAEATRGIGLSVVRWIVAAHGGELRLQSAAGALNAVGVLLPIAPGAAIV